MSVAKLKLKLNCLGGNMKKNVLIMALCCGLSGIAIAEDNFNLHIVNNSQNTYKIGEDKGTFVNHFNSLAPYQTIDYIIDKQNLVNAGDAGLGIELYNPITLGVNYIFQFYYEQPNQFYFKNWLISRTAAFSFRMDDNNKDLNLALCDSSYYESHNNSCN